jgi:peptidoglycan/LPS O-acetylase OafA/YrhL
LKVVSYPGVGLPYAASFLASFLLLFPLQAVNNNSVFSRVALVVGKHVFAIYLIHLPIIGLVRKFIAIDSILAPIVVFAVALLFVHVLRLYSRKTYELIF